MTKGNNIFLLPNTKTEVHSKFAELTPLIREKMVDIILARVEIENSKSKRRREILEELETIVPKECKHLITELEDTILAIGCERIEKTIFYVLENAEDIKKTVLGF